MLESNKSPRRSNHLQNASPAPWTFGKVLTVLTAASAAFSGAAARQLAQATTDTFGPASVPSSGAVANAPIFSPPSAHGDIGARNLTTPVARRELVSSIGAFGGVASCAPQLESSTGCYQGILGAFPAGFCNMTNLNQFDTYPAAPAGVTYADRDNVSTLYGSRGYGKPPLGSMSVNDVTMSEYTNNVGFMASLMAWTLPGGSGQTPAINLFAQLGRDPTYGRTHVGVNLYDPSTGIYNMNIVNSMLPVDSNGNHYLTVSPHNACNQQIVWPDLAAVGYAKMRNLPINDFGGVRPDDAMATLSRVDNLYALNGRGRWPQGLQGFANTLHVETAPQSGVSSKPNMAVMTTYNLADLPTVNGIYDGPHEVMTFLDGSSLRAYNGNFIYLSPYGGQMVIRPNWAYAVHYVGPEKINGAPYDMYNIYNPLGYNRPTDFLSANVPNPLKVPANFLHFVSDVVVTTRSING